MTFNTVYNDIYGNLFRLYPNSIQDEVCFTVYICTVLVIVCYNVYIYNCIHCVYVIYA